MSREHEQSEGHERFKELSALANAETLSASEWSELTNHLRNCRDCRLIHDEYSTIDKQGMPMLAADFSLPKNDIQWDDSAVQTKLFARVQEAETEGVLTQVSRNWFSSLITSFPHFSRTPFARAAAVACFVVGVALGAYRLGSNRTEVNAKQIQAAADARLRALATTNKAANEQLDAQANAISELQARTSKKEQEVERLQATLASQGTRFDELAKSRDSTETQLRAALEQRESLRAQLQSAQKAYDAARAELVSLRNERDRAVLKATALESKIEELTATNRDQERRLQNSEQYLSSDRDIRELMGARNLYIADVYDVDSSSRTRKPFGRVFYTQGKSLIFYAFDLDREPGVKNAAARAFQVWGRKNSDEGQPFNLGILYKDSETNRRWVLRFDDPKQLAEINAVFVTVEPHGGSTKPTSKPLLYALLRKEANHP
jgi:hypothetical protein